MKNVSVTKSLSLKKEKHLNYECHSLRDEILTFISGTGKLVIDKEVKR